MRPPDDDLQGTDRTRREFCVQACQAVSLITLGSVLQGCGGSPTSPSGSSTPLPVLNSNLINGTAVVTIDAASPLAPVGGLALVRNAGGDLLVTRTSDSSLTAVTAICTHEGCTITGFDGQVFVCPCHGSRYNTSGMVLGGPAPRPLRQFATQFVDPTLTITL